MKAKNTKLLSLSIFSLFLIVGILGVVSAGVFDMGNISSPSDTAHDAGSFDVTYNITYVGSNPNINVSFSSNVNSGTATISLPSTITLNQNETKTLTATVNFDSYQTGSIGASITSTPSSGTPVTKSFSVPILTSPSLSVSSSTIPKGQNSTTITVKNTGNVNFSNVVLTSSNDFQVSLSPLNFSLDAGDSKQVTVEVLTDLQDLNLAGDSVTITAASGNTTASGTVSVEGEYCNYEDLGNLNIRIDDVREVGISDVKFGDDTSWFPLDEVEVDIEVRNDGNDDIKNVEIEWGLYDTTTGDWYIDDKESDFRLKDGDDKTVTISFKLKKHMNDLRDGNFVFFAKATGEDREFDSNKTCVSDSEDIDVIIENDFVVLDNIQVPETVQCGSEAQINADVWNVGDDDQNDVSVVIFNSELGITKEILVGDIDSLDDSNLDTTITIPEDAKEKYYNLKFSVYDEDNDIYQTDFDDDDSEFSVPLKVEGSCGAGGVSGGAKAIVSAILESGGNAGENLVVRATITNPSDEQNIYSLNAAGYTDFADSAELSQSTLLLDAGESKDILITFDVKDDSEGAYTFNIEAVSGKEITVQPVSVSIESAGGFKGLSSLFTGKAIAGSNSYLWAIGILNIILVIIIIVVAVRITRQGRKSSA